MAMAGSVPMAIDAIVEIWPLLLPRQAKQSEPSTREQAFEAGQPVACHLDRKPDDGPTVTLTDVDRAGQESQGQCVARRGG